MQDNIDYCYHISIRINQTVLAEFFLCTAVLFLSPSRLFLKNIAD